MSLGPSIERPGVALAEEPLTAPLDGDEDLPPTPEDIQVNPADLGEFDQTYLARREQWRLTGPRPSPAPFPLQVLPRMAFTINYNFVFDETEEEWVPQNPFSGGGLLQAVRDSGVLIEDGPLELDFDTDLSATTSGSDPATVTVSFTGSAGASPWEQSPDTSMAALYPDSAAADDSSTGGGNSFAVGPNAETGSGTDNIAIGRNADVTGIDDFRTLIGPFASAAGDNSTAVGVSAITDGSGATALGDIAEASGDNATATGAETGATADDATAVGSGADATAQDSVALGRSAEATAQNSVAVGDVTNNHQNTTINRGGVGGTAAGSLPAAADLDQGQYIVGFDGSGDVVLRAKDNSGNTASTTLLTT